MRRLKVGMVLSGGGGYGAFQAGVIDALLEAGIKPTYFAGTSIGALNSVLASGHSVIPLRKFWLDMPITLQKELSLANPQWIAMIESFKKIAFDASENAKISFTVGGSILT